MYRLRRMTCSCVAIVAIASMNVVAFTQAASAGKGHSAPSRNSNSGKSNSGAQHRNQQRVIQRHHGVRHLHAVKQPHVVKPQFQAKVPAFVARKHAVSSSAQQLAIQKGLPLLKPTTQTAFLKPRLALPQNVQPKLTLVKPPKLAVGPKFAPFVQRHWKKAFFWVAVAGIGYLTIPELYYDRWATYVDEDDYDSAADLLALAALEDDDDIVRIAKPAQVDYRYQVPVGPSKAVAAAPATQAAPTTSTADAANACTLKPFIDRKWSQPFSWVLVPDVGNVTVPDQSYERFIGLVSSEPPNFDTACIVLAEAAAADTVSPAETSGLASSTN